MDHYRPIRVNKILEFVVPTRNLWKNGKIVPMKHGIGALKIEILAKNHQNK